MNTLRFSEQSPVTPDAQLLLGELSAILTSVTGNNGQRHFLPNTMSEPVQCLNLEVTLSSLIGSSFLQLVVHCNVEMQTLPN